MKSDVLEAPPRHYRLRPAQVIVLGFLAIILAGAFLLCLPISNRSGKWLNFINALFTSTSAVCVTGLAVVPTAVNYNMFGQIVILLLIQAGGLGFMTLTTTFLIMLRRKITLKDRLVIQEALNQNETKGMVRLARNILLLTFAVEGGGMLLLLPGFVHQNGGIGVFQAVFTSVSAFCNAGFDIFGTIENPYVGLTQYTGNPLVSLTVCALIILGGLGFTVIMDVTKNRFRFRKLSLHTRVVLIATGILLLGGFFFFFGMEYSNPQTMGNLGVGSKILASFFQSVTARTAGFNTISQSGLHPASKIVTMLLMFIGASPGSTGGGIKTTTITIIVLMMIAGLKSRDDVVLSQKSVNYKNCFKAVSVVFLSFIAVMALTLLLMITEMRTAFPDPAMHALDNFMYEAFSAFGTVGLSTGITPYLSGAGKVLLMFVMFFGRLGPVTIGMFFIGRNRTNTIKYPEVNIMIG